MNREAGTGEISEVEFVQWGVRNKDTAGYAFTSRERDAAERQMATLTRSSARRNYELIRQDVRVLSETWHGDIEVVPWHSRCSWVGSIEGGPVSCSSHDWHGKDEPVPDRFVFGATQQTAAASPLVADLGGT